MSWVGCGVGSSPESGFWPGVGVSCLRETQTIRPVGDRAPPSLPTHASFDLYILLLDFTLSLVLCGLIHCTRAGHATWSMSRHHATLLQVLQFTAHLLLEELRISLILKYTICPNSPGVGVGVWLWAQSRESGVLLSFLTPEPES